MNVNPVKINSLTIKICKAISLVSALATIYILLLFSPILFGQCVFAVKQTDCTGYPINSLAYYAYMPAEDYFPGDCAAIQTERGLLLLTLTENDPEARVWHMGFVADDWPVLLPIFAGGAALFYTFSRVLTKKPYQPKYGRKPGEEAENGADT